MHQDHENAHRFFQQSRDIGRLLGDDQGQAYALVLMSLVALRQGDEAIRPFIEESIRLFQSAGNQRWLSLAYNFLGTAFLFEDNPDAAEKALLTSASLYESTDDPWGWGLTLGSLGALAIWRKEWALAETRLTESLRLLQNTKDNESLLGTLDLLAYLHRREDSDQSGGDGRESGLVSMGIAGNRTVNRTSIPWPRQSAELYTTVRKWVTARVMAPQIAENLQAPGSHAALSDRERQVLQLIDAGKNNIEIADALYISVNTVKTHISHIFSKVGARNRVEATNAVRPRPRLTVIRSDHDAVR